jgi:hypothetical protein
MYDFEYDLNKSTSNLKKHDIDFVAAQELWFDSELKHLGIINSTFYLSFSSFSAVHKELRSWLCAYLCVLKMKKNPA